MGTLIAGPPKLGRYHLLESVSSKTFTPREYQVELLDAAREKNTVVCLGTGAGKTFIAVMLIKELAHETRHPFSSNGRRTVFLVPTGLLVHQQAKIIEDYTDLKVAKFYGFETSHCSVEKWFEAIKMCNVVVSTPDIIKMLIHHGFLPVTKINLMIFDECHRAVRNHPYCEIMQCFDVCPPESMPRILGLSASLVNNKCKPAKVEQEIRNLERNLKSTVETASELTMLSKYGSKPEEYLVQYREFYDDSENFSIALSEINSALIFLDDINNYYETEFVPEHFKQPRRYLIEISHVIMTLGPWCALQAITLFSNEILSNNMVYQRGRNLPFILILTVLQKVSHLCKRILAGMDEATTLLHSAPPKLQELAKLLKRYKPSEPVEKTVQTNGCDVPVPKEITPAHNKRTVESSNENRRTSFNSQRTTSNWKARSNLNDYHRSTEDPKSLCCVIFVRQRITAFLLNLYLIELSKHVEDFEFLSPSYIIGHGKNSEGIGNINLASNKQQEILQKFRAREYNIICTTSVAEEGLDIPRCNLVIRFDPPENFRAYVQSKGRARSSDSVFVLMVCSKKDESEKFVEDFCDFKTVEEILLAKCHKLDYMEDEVLDPEVADKLVEPYMPVKEVGSPRVTLSSAIGLVNRYCAKLPSDTFTRLTAKWKINENYTDSDLKYQCTVQLPINSPLKTAITGEPMRSKKLAKMSVAFKICIELHKIGELDDNLLPAGKESVKCADDFIDNEMEITENSARPGTTKRRQYYFKQVADALNNSVPKSGMPSFLYLFHMVLTCPIPEEQNTRGRKIHDPADSSRNFAILLSKPIPPICNFPVFTRSGEVTIQIECISSNLILNEDELEELAYFHKYTFSDVLRLEKYPMMFAPSESECSFFIVPVNKEFDQYDIDWKFVHVINEQKNKKPRKLLESERKTFQFIEASYSDAVVMPWYRNLDKPQFFYVAEICTYLTPMSDFPDAGYGSFKGYYEQKYGISIMNCSQPLLDVDHTSARLNLLTPRYVNRKGVTLPTSSESTKKTKRENLQQKQILVPELCIIHPFPASFWRKAVCLPCILYRTNALLLAEQLRTAVAREIYVGMEKLPINFEWPMLDFGWTLADVLKAQAALKENLELEEKSTLVHHCSDRKNKVLSYEGNQNAIYLKNVPNSGSNHFEEEPIYSANDFEIDVFDPSKCHIPDDDDLLEQELSNIDFTIDSFFGAPTTNTTCLDNEISTVAEPYIRYGSPSNFENTGWDSEWDTEAGDSNFYSLNLPGLGYISAPGIFNMESLSMDLARERKESEFEDSLNEKSSLSSYDDSDIDDTETENYCTDENMSLKGNFTLNTTCQDMCQSDWLSNSSAGDTIFSEFVENTEDLDKTIVQEVLCKRESEKKKIKFLNDAYDEYIDNQTFSSTYEKIFSVIKQMECYQEVPINQNKAIFSSDYALSKCSLCGLGCETNNEEKVNHEVDSVLAFGELLPNREEHGDGDSDSFLVSFDATPHLSSHPGPSPSIILQAFTMSNANDGINLERLETVGDSFLKYAITAYLFCMFPNIHEGKLSFLRSKQISNLNLYKLGKKKCLGELMVATKFEPNDNWLPPCYVVPKGLEKALIESGIPVNCWNIRNLSNLTNMSEEEIRQSVIEQKEVCNDGACVTNSDANEEVHPVVPYNLLTQHSIPDKSIADCVEALIGAYLVTCGSRGALLFMSYLGLRVLPVLNKNESNDSKPNYGFLEPPPSPLLTHVPNPDLKLEKLLSGYSAFEEKIGYTFKDKAYLLQAFTHASYYYNTLTDCYQRLEFLGDAVLDYLITRHLYEDPKKHSPGTLTDLRSALVNNTFFASLAVKYDYHKYFKAISPSLFNVINKFVQLKESIAFEDYSKTYYLEEEECEEVEEVEVPKALGDIFEAVAGAIYLDSEMSLDTVWKVYYAMMKPEIQYFSNHVPKSPIRELLELEPQTAKFEKAEMTLNGKVRVRVEVFGKGTFVGVGRNKRIAKCTAAKRALRELKKTEDVY